MMAEKFRLHPELDFLHEIVPNVSYSALYEILIRNDFNLDRSIDESLSLSTKTTKSTQHNNDHDIVQNDDKTQIEKISQEGKQILNEIKGHNANKPATKGKLLVPLPDDFLIAPEFRTIITSDTSDSIEFTINFNRHNEMLGLNILDVNGDIVIHKLLDNNNKPSLGMKAGIHVGDLLVGINNEYFSPGVDVQDIIELLKFYGKYTTLHFIRYYKIKKSFNTSNSLKIDPINIPTTNHKLTDILIEQHLASNRQSRSITQTMKGLKTRLIEWDSGLILRRIKDWNLDQYFIPTSYASSHTSNIHYNTSSSHESRYTDINIRPAFSVHVTLDEGINNENSYILWIIDIRSGMEWSLSKHFDDFLIFRDLLVHVRPSLSHIEFPSSSSNINLKATASTLANIIEQRIQLFQKFIHYICKIVCINFLHPSKIKISSILQDFLGIKVRLENLNSKDFSTKNTIFVNTIQVYMHNILQINVFENLFNSYIQQFHKSYGALITSSRTPMTGKKIKSTTRKQQISAVKQQVLSANNISDMCLEMLESQSNYIDRLVSILLDGVVDDCYDIMKRLILKHTNSMNCEQLYGHLINNKTDEQCSSLSSSSFYSDTREIDTTDNTSLKSYSSIEELKEIFKLSLRKQLEIELFLPCKNLICQIVINHYQQDELKIQNKVKVLMDFPQSYYGIPTHFTSPSSWNEAVHLMQTIYDHWLPVDQLNILMAVAKLIPVIYQKEHMSIISVMHQDKRNTVTTSLMEDQNKLNNTIIIPKLSADEFLPIFIYIIIQSKLQNILLLKTLLCGLCQKEKKISELGYYLTTFEAAIYHIEEFDIFNSTSTNTFFGFPFDSQNSGNYYSESQDPNHCNNIPSTIGCDIINDRQGSADYNHRNIIEERENIPIWNDNLIISSTDRLSESISMEKSIELSTI